MQQQSLSLSHPHFLVLCVFPCVTLSLSTPPSKSTLWLFFFFPFFRVFFLKKHQHHKVVYPGGESEIILCVCVCAQVYGVVFVRVRIVLHSSALV